MTAKRASTSAAGAARPAAAAGARRGAPRERQRDRERLPAAGRRAGREPDACSRPEMREARVQEGAAPGARSKRLPIRPWWAASRIQAKYWNWSAASRPSRRTAARPFVSRRGEHDDETAASATSAAQLDAVQAEAAWQGGRRIVPRGGAGEVDRVGCIARQRVRSHVRRATRARLRRACARADDGPSVREGLDGDRPILPEGRAASARTRAGSAGAGAPSTQNARRGTATRSLRPPGHASHPGRGRGRLGDHHRAGGREGARRHPTATVRPGPRGATRVAQRVAVAAPPTGARPQVIEGCGCERRSGSRDGPGGRDPMSASSNQRAALGVGDQPSLGAAAAIEAELARRGRPRHGPPRGLAFGQGRAADAEGRRDRRPRAGRPLARIAVGASSQSRSRRPGPGPRVRRKHERAARQGPGRPRRLGRDPEGDDRARERGAPDSGRGARGATCPRPEVALALGGAGRPSRRRPGRACAGARDDRRAAARVAGALPGRLEELVAVGS